jgi:putative alpha-1,2-mannosidase
LEEIYLDASDGLPGNDDLGAMGAWYVWVSLGLYPEIPGVAGFSLSTPSFPRICIHLPNGKEIVSESSQDGKPYITSMTLNGKTVKGTWIPWETLAEGAQLKYKTSDKPNRKWGTQIAPPSYQ